MKKNKPEKDLKKSKFYNSSNPLWCGKCHCTEFKLVATVSKKPKLSVLWVQCSKCDETTAYEFTAVVPLI